MRRILRVDVLKETNGLGDRVHDEYETKAHDQEGIGERGKQGRHPRPGSPDQ